MKLQKKRFSPKYMHKKVHSRTTLIKIMWKKRNTILQEYLFVILNTFIKNQLRNLSKLQWNKIWILTRMLVKLRLKVCLIVHIHTLEMGTRSKRKGATDDLSRVEWFLHSVNPAQWHLTSPRLVHIIESLYALHPLSSTAPPGPAKQ